MMVLTSNGRHYGNLLGFRFHWALLACLRWSLGALGLPWVPLDGHWGSIWHLWGSIGAPLERHWAPFVAFGGPLGVTLEKLCNNFHTTLTLLDSLLHSVRHFWIQIDLKQKWKHKKKTKRLMKGPKCHYTCIFVGPNRGL